MSKAFTSEETPESPPLTRSPPALAPGEVRYVTPEGYGELCAALARLEEERVAASGHPEQDRAARVEDLERRAALLKGTLAALTVLGPEAAPEGRVAFGTWVTVEDDAGMRITWRIVGPDEADPKRGLISVDAPLARALLGREAGETVEVQRPRGRSELTLVSIQRSPST
jgi:transcription elongation factor GreB